MARLLHIGCNDYTFPYDEVRNGYSNGTSGGSMFLCIGAGLLGIWVVTSLLKSHHTPKQYQEPWNPVYMPAHAMTASARLVKNIISAKLATADANITAGNVNPTTKDIPDSDMIVVADGQGPWKEFTDEVKDSVDKSVREYLKSNEKVVMMVYAAWCPHCSQMMPAFIQTAKKNSGDAKFMLCHAEAMRRQSFTPGPEALFQLQYFPTILVKMPDGTIKETNPEQIQAAIQDTVPTEAEQTQEMLMRMF